MKDLDRPFRPWLSVMVALALLAGAHSEAGTMPGQIIVDPKHPAWLVYNRDSNGDGKLDPFFMCGPGDPEGFLYRGRRLADGSRRGDQMQIIRSLRGTGANCIYLMAVRSHGGDGGPTENPFLDGDPRKGLDADILKQWEKWFSEMDRNGIVIYFFFYDDANIDQFAIQYNRSSAAAMHRGMVAAWRQARGRYSLNMSESSATASAIKKGDRAALRRINWACAMGGAYVMWLGAFTSKGGTPTPEMLTDAGRLVRFFESTGVNEMAPHDELGGHGTEYLLARPGHSYIAYASDLKGSIGLRNLRPGRYDFTWLDCADGKTLKRQAVPLAAGNGAWRKPPGMGAEVAVYITRR